MAIEILDKLHDSGELRELVHSGLISHNVALWRKVYHACDSQVNSGIKKSHAVINVAYTFGISDRMVYRILERFKK
jgi:hypothetical protein